MKTKFHSNENIKWHTFMNTYWMTQTPEFINPRTRMFFSSIYPLSKALSFLGEPVACLQIFRSFVCCSQSFSQRVEELKCFLFWDCWTGNSSPIKADRFWLSWSGTMVSCGARTHTHTHTLSLPVLSRTSLNWREDWLQFESGIQSGIIKFDIALSTSTVSGSYLMKEN